MGATLHSPAGAFYAGIQWGPIFGSIKEKNRQSQHGFSGVFGGSFGWYGFVEETTYVFVKLSTIKLPPNLSLRNPVIHEDHRNTLTYGTVGLGYFVPEFRSWMSRKVISLF
jgi:hypothetical protein